MDSTTFMLWAVIIIVVGLVLLVVNANASFNTWYGDSGFLKEPKTFTMNLFGFFDFMNLGFSLLFFYMVAVLFFRNYGINDDFGAILIIGILVLVYGFLPFFHFYKKCLFYKLNGKLDYTFDPNDKTLQINDSYATSISESDISVIRSFNVEGKLDFDFKIIYLKNGKEIVISSDLPFCDYMLDFFGKNIPYEHIEFSPIDIFKYLKLLRNYI